MKTKLLILLCLFSVLELFGEGSPGDQYMTGTDSGGDYVLTLVHTVSCPSNLPYYSGSRYRKDISFSLDNYYVFFNYSYSSTIYYDGAPYYLFNGTKKIPIRVSVYNNDSLSSSGNLINKVVFLYDISYCGDFLPIEVDGSAVYFYTKQYLNGDGPTITSPTTLNYNALDNFNYTITADGDPPIHFQVSGLPNYLSFDDNNSITGVLPDLLEDYTFNFTVKASNQAGEDTKVVTVNVTALTRAVKITSGLTRNVSGGSNFNYEITAVGDPTITFSAGQLPQWLSFDGNNSLTGLVPDHQQAESYTVVLNATNGSTSDMKLLQINVSANVSAPQITSSSQVQCPAGGLTNYHITASGSAPVSCNAVVSSLPDWVSAAGAYLSIIPPYSAIGQTFDIIVQAVNEYGNDVVTVQLVIIEPDGNVVTNDGTFATESTLQEVRDILQEIKKDTGDLVDIGNEQLDVQNSILELLTEVFKKEEEEEPEIGEIADMPAVELPAIEDNTEQERDLDLSSKFNVLTNNLTEKGSVAPVWVIPFSVLTNLGGFETYRMNDAYIDFAAEPFASIAMVIRTFLCGLVFFFGIWSLIRIFRTFEF